MTKKPLPKILQAPMEDFERELPKKLRALAEHYGGYDWGTSEPDWAAVALSMAMEHEPGFKQAIPHKKRGAKPKQETAERDFWLFIKMLQEGANTPQQAEAAANAVAVKNPSLGNEEFIRVRWQVLKSGDPACERMLEYMRKRCGHLLLWDTES